MLNRLLGYTMWRCLLIGLSFIAMPISVSTVNAATDSATIKIGVVVEKARVPMACNYGFKSDDVSLYNSSNDNCKYDMKKLEEKATQLVSRDIRKIDGMRFVAVTITAP